MVINSCKFIRNKGDNDKMTYKITRKIINKIKTVITIAAIAVFLVVSVTGCGTSARNVNRKNSVDNVMKNQMEAEDSTQETQEDTTDSQNTETAENSESQNKSDTQNDIPSQGSSALTGSNVIRGNGSMSENSSCGVDYDLTNMDSDMVYATVYQLMMDPLSYEGKTFRITGQYYTSYDEKSGKTYEFCLIKDALACCAQGLEFVWGDGSHSVEEYPAQESEITVEGTFETYTEDGDSNRYCHLVGCILNGVH